MTLRLRFYWDLLWSSFWFLPALMSVAAGLLCWLTVWLDQGTAGEWAAAQAWLNAGTGQGAIALLGAIAGSMISVTGIVFSLTLVALTMTSSQFGPRLLRNFMRDRFNQLVLGTFIASFTHALLLLRSIRDGADGFVPHLSVSFSVLLVLFSLGVLIVFIHHIAVSIQADSVVTSVADDLNSAIDDMLPNQDADTRHSNAQQHGGSDNSENDSGKDAIPVTGTSIPASRDGYLQMIDQPALLRLATEHDCVIRLQVRPGNYLTADTSVAITDSPALEDEAIRQFASVFIIGYQRTPGQDLLFSFNQLVEIGVRALSPGINDPFTAISCIDRAGSALCRLAASDLPAAVVTDADDTPRLYLQGLGFAEILNTVIDPFRRHASGSPAVLLRLLEILQVVAGFLQRDEDREALLRQGRMLVNLANQDFSETEDINLASQAYEQLLSRLPDRHHLESA